jgi:membrane protein
MSYVRFQQIAPLFTTAFQNWQNDRAPRMGAALAYYIALSLAPTVLILVAVVGLLFGAQAAEGRLVAEIQNYVGYEGAVAIQTMVKGARSPSGGVVATVIGLVTVLFAASAVVSELRDAMNTIWKVPDDDGASTERSIVNLIKDRLLSFALVLASGIFLVASLVVNALILAAGKYLDSGVAAVPRLVQTTDWIVSFAAITALFAFIFKALPRVELRWSDVASGAVLTSVLFAGGKILLDIYLSKAGFMDTYGATGSMVLILVWVYYSAQVLYLGAEFTRAYACSVGSMKHVAVAKFQGANVRP